MSFPLFAVPAVELPFQLPGILVAAAAHTKWVWAAIILLSVLALVARTLNWLATLFEPCPHCEKVVRKRQRICHHCFTPVKAQRVVKAASPRATRPLNAPPRSGRLKT